MSPLQNPIIRIRSRERRRPPGICLPKTGRAAVTTEDNSPYYERNMSWPAHLKATLILGMPLIGAQLAQLGINTTDVLIIGRLGTTQLAAMVLASQYFFTIF